MRKCLKCGKYEVKKPHYDWCYKCFHELEEKDKSTPVEENFEDNLKSNRIHTVYIMSYSGTKEKIGYTGNLPSRLIEIKQVYPDNKLVYFREFTSESQARRFAAWLRERGKRTRTNFVSTFQDKVRKVVDYF